MNTRSIAAALRDMDAALAHAVRLEVEAKQWRITSGRWRTKYEKACEEIAALTSQIKLANETASELMRLVDAVRSERDTWRAAADR